jgi:luciferase family oxidoreductase group 1
MQLSVLDLAPIPEGRETAAAFRDALDLARDAERLGYTRLWYAEHHGMSSIGSTSPEVLIAAAAGVTTTIRVGSGGVMLLNHAPLRIVEAFRTLEALHPGRIDLGLGRAPGGDGLAMRALRAAGGEAFSNHLAELLAFDEGQFPPDHPFARISVAPGGVRLPPLWLLGSSGASARAAGQLGIGYGFAAHFSPTPARPAFDDYRAAFQPSAAFPAPRALLCLSVVCAPTDAEAEFLSGSQALTWAQFHTGRPRRLMAPEVAAAHAWTDAERAVVAQSRQMWIVGSPDTVRADIAARVEASGADEVMVSTQIHDPGLRRRSFALLAEAFGLSSASS